MEREEEKEIDDAPIKNEERTFNEDQVKGIIKEVVEQNILQGSAYLHSRISNWNNSIVHSVVEKLSALNKAFKYIGIHATTTCYWDNNHDGSTTYRHDTNSMYVIVNVWGLCVG
ncbi:18401_t:CDS:2 [Rhizophagus irregularis]|nr:18401_t:CDS:2 [Rhizophagus irregularis]